MMQEKKEEEDKNMENKPEEMKTEEQQGNQKKEQENQEAENQKEEEKEQSKLEPEKKVQEENQPKLEQKQEKEKNEKDEKLKVENPQQQQTLNETEETLFKDASKDSEKPEDSSGTENSDTVIVVDISSVATVEVLEETVLFKSESKTMMKELENINTPQTKNYEDKMIKPVKSEEKTEEIQKIPQPLELKELKELKVDLESEKHQQSSVIESEMTVEKPVRTKKLQIIQAQKKEKESVSVQMEPESPAPLSNSVQTEQPVLKKRHSQVEEIWYCDEGEEEKDESCGFVLISSILPCIFAPLK